uniref:F-box domain-containing protein n=1 Tax=Oryza punctata TaxID=4537 RepID=A0A0E0LVN1_ORYPU
MCPQTYHVFFSLSSINAFQSLRASTTPRCAATAPSEQPPRTASFFIAAAAAFVVSCAGGDDALLPTSARSRGSLSSRRAASTFLTCCGAYGVGMMMQNLRSLDLHACLDQISSTSWVFCKLRCAPNLETLEIEVDRDDDEVDAGSVEGFANAQTSDDIFPRLRDVSGYSVALKAGLNCELNHRLKKRKKMPWEGEAKRRRSPAVEPDYLAVLPPGIVDNIISRLDIRDVTRTSVLSHAWRGRWHSVHGLGLDFRFSDPAAAISSVLKRSAAPVRMVSLPVPRRWFHRAVRWLRLLPRKHVQSLWINFEVSLEVEILGHKPNLDPSIFSCLELSSLCLELLMFFHPGEMDTSPPRRKQRLLPPEGDPDDTTAAAVAAGASLDSLPEELLENIVSRLSLRDAVRTSAISRSWTRRWESTPDLRHYWPRRSRPEAICAVLGRYACNVCQFCTWGIRAEAFPHIDEWLPLLAAKGIQILTLSFWDYSDVNVEYYTLHPAIFACGQLTSLHLERCFLPTAPEGFAGFPNLTMLSLVYVGLPENGERKLEAMIRMSPSLVSLELSNVEVTDDDFEDWIIQAPNLERLTITSDIDYGWQIHDLPSIQDANINIEDYAIDRDFVKLLTSLAQVGELELFIPKLRSLTLHTNFYKTSSILSTFGLLMRAPNLLHLEIEITDHENQSDEVDIDFLNALWTNSPFANLDYVSIKSATCWSNEMCFIEFVLSKARVLREFYIYHDDTGSYSKPREEAIIELAKYKRASPKAKVFFRDMESFLLRFEKLTRVLLKAPKPTNQISDSAAPVVVPLAKRMWNEKGETTGGYMVVLMRIETQRSTLCSLDPQEDAGILSLEFTRVDMGRNTHIWPIGFGLKMDSGPSGPSSIAITVASLTQ